MKPKKIPQALDKVVRDIHDCDEFSSHVASILERYRREHALESGPRGRDVRRTLRAFRKHAAALTQWLQSAQRRQSSLEYEALARIGAALYTAPNQALASSAAIMSWLEQAQHAAEQAEAQLTPKRSATNAPRVAAEALRATFEHHGLKWSAQVTKKSVGAPIRLLCAIAKSAGDVLAPDDARSYLIAAASPRPAK